MLGKLVRHGRHATTDWYEVRVVGDMVQWRYGSTTHWGEDRQTLADWVRAQTDGTGYVWQPACPRRRQAGGVG